MANKLTHQHWVQNGKIVINISYPLIPWN